MTTKTRENGYTVTLPEVAVPETVPKQWLPVEPEHRGRRQMLLAALVLGGVLAAAIALLVLEPWAAQDVDVATNAAEQVTLQAEKGELLARVPAVPVSNVAEASVLRAEQGELLARVPGEAVTNVAEASVLRAEKEEVLAGSDSGLAAGVDEIAVLRAERDELLSRAGREPVDPDASLPDEKEFLLGR